MALGTPGRKSAPLGVLAMAVALVLAAILGAALGFVWQSSGFGEDDAQDGSSMPVDDVA